MRTEFWKQLRKFCKNNRKIFIDFCNFRENFEEIMKKFVNFSLFFLFFSNKLPKFIIELVKIGEEPPPPSTVVKIWGLGFQGVPHGLPLLFPINLNIKLSVLG